MGEHPSRRPRTKDVSVLDALGPGHHGVDQGQHLAPRSGVTGYITEVDQLIGQLVGAEPLGQGGHQRKPRPGDRPVVVEGHPKARRIVRKFLHRNDAFLLMGGVDFSESHLPNTGGIFREWSDFRTPDHQSFSVVPG